MQAALAWWSTVSPFSPYGPTIALVFVLLVAAGKAIIEDKKRHREDRITNNSTAHVVQPDGAGFFLINTAATAMSSMLTSITTIGLRTWCSPGGKGVCGIPWIRALSSCLLVPEACEAMRAAWCQAHNCDRHIQASTQRSVQGARRM